jgi:hypothetical protein
MRSRNSVATLYGGLSNNTSNEQALSYSITHLIAAVSCNRNPWNVPLQSFHMEQDPMTSISDALEHLQLFEHSPLNHEVSSIRLIRILPDRTSQRYTQCEVRHATTASTYVCLSYVWGETDKGNWIILNNCRLWVRDNLWQFLRAARRIPQLCDEWLWIDALSINQINNAERNQQVQQMGLIFRSAKGIISWLGNNKKIEKYFNSILNREPRSRAERVRFDSCEYWERAWVSYISMLHKHAPTITLWPRSPRSSHSHVNVPSWQETP